VREAFRPVMSLCGECLRLESGALEVVQEVGLGNGGPECNLAPLLERVPNGSEAPSFIDALITSLNHGGGAVIDIQHYSVIGGGAGATDDMEDVAGDDFDPLVVKEQAIDVGQELAVPGHNLWEELRNLDAGMAADELESTLKAKPKAEPADEHARIRTPPEAVARQLGQEELGGRGGAAHQLPAIQLEKVVAVVLLESELRTVRSAGLGEGAEWFHKGERGELNRTTQRTQRGRRQPEDRKGDWTKCF